MGCVQQVIKCTELTIGTLELSRNLLVTHVFACQVLVCFVSHVIIF